MKEQTPYSRLLGLVIDLLEVKDKLTDGVVPSSLADPLDEIERLALSLGQRICFQEQVAVKKKVVDSFLAHVGDQVEILLNAYGALGDAAGILPAVQIGGTAENAIALVDLATYVDTIFSGRRDWFANRSDDLIVDGSELAQSLRTDLTKLTTDRASARHRPSPTGEASVIVPSAIHVDGRPGPKQGL